MLHKDKTTKQTHAFSGTGHKASTLDTTTKNIQKTNHNYFTIITKQFIYVFIHWFLQSVLKRKRRARQIMTTVHESDFWALLRFLGQSPQLRTPSPCANLDSGFKPSSSHLPWSWAEDTPTPQPTALSSQLTAVLAKATGSNLGMVHSETVMTPRRAEPPASAHQPLPSTSLIR